ncbi:hypothetical protein PCANC_08945 [Puccinia coronata f. sp. avenae]|uniref:Spindle pole body component n=1 Tax=Puccinia coronata f. sp. avenae TaxID=200324 RepID=A0A2N5T2H5_9BASI|nr:hypothetical protein PCANC_08945 [Puccinia coronata f. sp. avenae]
MAPTPASLSLNRLIQLTVDRSERRQGIRPSLKKTLHALIAFPPQLEPSYRETHDRWNRVLERLRIENQEIVSREIEKRHAELLQMADKEDSQLWKNLDSIRAFLLELHSPPSLECYNRAVEFQRAENKQLQVETQAEMDLRLYRTIMDSEPLVGDHWQTDIYAGSSSSLSDSTPSSDWDSDSSDRNSNPPAEPQHLTLQSHTQKNAPRVSFETPQEINPQDRNTSHLGFEKLQEFMCHPYSLKPDVGIDPLPELIAIREVLAALLNLGGALIYTASSTPNDTTTILSAHVPTLLNQSRTTSLSLLSSFLPTLCSLKKLRLLAEPNDHQPRQKTQTEEAFAASVLALLCDFDIFLTSIELQLLNLPGGHAANERTEIASESVMSLMRLHHRLEQNGWIELFAALANIVPDSSSAHDLDNRHASTKGLLDDLYTITCQFDSHCNSITAVERIKVIFFRTCGPVWAWIGDWIVHGRLPESTVTGEWAPIEEFFVTTPGDSDPAGNWWDDHYVLNEPAVPVFLGDFVADILQAGKATALCRILDIFSDAQLSPWPKLDDLVTLASSPLVPPLNPPADPEPTNVLKAHLRHRAFSSGCRTKTVPQASSVQEVDGPKPSFDIHLHSHLDQHLSPLVVKNHCHLCTQFSSHLKLSTYLTKLNEFFLLGSKVSIHFLKKVFEDANDSSKSSLISTHNTLLSTTHWWDEQAMDRNLSKAFEYAPSPIISSCLPKIKISPSIRAESDPLKCLEFIQISLTIPSPLHYVVDNAHVIGTYNRCFVFLSQLARAAWTLDSMIWVKPTIPLSTFKSTKEFERRAESKEFYRLKNRLAWFVNLISDYSWNLVISNWRTRFLEALDLYRGDLSQTISHTRRWLTRLAGLLFLSEQCESLNGLIIQVLQLCTRSHEVWTSFNRQANTIQLVSEVNEKFALDNERRRRQMERRKRRMENEQYTLIEEESRHIIHHDASMISGGDGQEGEGGQEHSQHTSTLGITYLADSSLALPPTMLADQSPKDALRELQRMNREFEKLTSAIQRAVGKLCRPPRRKTGALHTVNLPGGGVHEPDGVGLEDFQDLDTLTLLECRLDEGFI